MSRPYDDKCDQYDLNPDRTVTADASEGAPCKCYNVHGGTRCDVCFGPLPGTHPKPQYRRPIAWPQYDVEPPVPQVRAGLHNNTFDYLKPTDEQLRIMNMLRFAAKVYSEAIENFVPDGPDKTFVLRNHRTNAMWVNIAVTRLADGTPRT